MIPQNRRIVKWEIRRLPYKGGIGRTILPPVLPFMVCTQLPAHGHCFYVHGLLTALTHLITGCTDSVTGKTAVYLQFVCGMLPIFLQIRAVLFTIPRSAHRRDFRHADSGVRRGLPAFVNVYKNEVLFSTFRQFEQIAPRRSGKAGRGGRQGAKDRRILHWCITLFPSSSNQPAQFRRRFACAGTAQGGRRYRAGGLFCSPSCKIRRIVLYYHRKNRNRKDRKYGNNCKSRRDRTDSARHDRTPNRNSPGQ